MYFLNITSCQLYSEYVGIAVTICVESAQPDFRAGMFVSNLSMRTLKCVSDRRHSFESYHGSHQSLQRAEIRQAAQVNSDHFVDFTKILYFCGYIFFAFHLRGRSRNIGEAGELTLASVSLLCAL